MKILYLASEVAPYTKVGGLADVAGALPAALAALGHDVRVAMPLYGSISIEKNNFKPVIPGMDVPIGQGTTGCAVYEGALAGYAGGPPVPVYFVQNQHHFERPNIYGYGDDADRFVVFCQAALRMLPLLDWKPDLVHANDWHTALAPHYLKTIYRFDTFLGGIRSAFSIHNLAYQGWQSYQWLPQAGLEGFGVQMGDREGQVNLMGRGIASADGVSTVSPTYAAQILTPAYGEGLDWLLNYRWGHLWGILNGIDTTVFDPATDKNLVSNYDLNSIEKRAANKAELQRKLGLPLAPQIPLIGMVSRLADQKGFDLLASALDQLMQRNVQLVILGTGEYYYHELLWNLAQRHPHRLSVTLAFSLEIAQQIYGGSDFFLMPSRFEPCGLGQMIAMRYGSVPVVRHTGGLADTVQEYQPGPNTGNGFVFGPYEAPHLLAAIDRAINIFGTSEGWSELIKLNMRKEFSWINSARQYLDFYHSEVLT